MSSDFLPIWAPDANPFKRAVYMSSTDDVVLVGTVRGEEEEGQEPPAGGSTTPFGPHERLERGSEEPPDEAAQAEASPEGPEASPAQETPDSPMASPDSDHEVEGALTALEAEMAGSDVDPETLAAIEKNAFNRGKATAMAEMASKMEEIQAENDRLSAIAERIEPLVNGLDSLRVNMIRKASEDVADMALHMARRVVGETLAVHPKALRKLVADALERLPGEDEVTIRVRPEDLSVIEEHLPTRRKIRLLADESLEGGCVVEAQCGEVSASVEAAFTGLRAAVEEWLEEQK
jgi:flagellar biosynthesis/type III secretory pathway protein FliH